MDWFARLHHVVQTLLIICAALIMALVYWAMRGEPPQPDWPDREAFLFTMIAIAWAVCAGVTWFGYIAMRYIFGR